MKRRVRTEIRQREPGTVKTGTEGCAEHGLGVAHRLRETAQAATGAPVIAQECVGTLKGRFREEPVKQGGTTRVLFVLDAKASRAFLLCKNITKTAMCRLRRHGLESSSAWAGTAHVRENFMRVVFACFPGLLSAHEVLFVSAFCSRKIPPLPGAEKGDSDRESSHH